MTWVPVKIGSISNESVFLVNVHGFSEEYQVNGCDFSKYKAGEKIEIEIENSRLKAIRRPGEEVQTITGELMLLTATGIKVFGLDPVFRNDVEIPEDVKVGVTVEMTYSGQNLLSVKRIIPPEKPPEIKKGSGKITALILSPPHLEYEYSYTPPGQERKTNTARYDHFSDKALEQIKGFKVGDWVLIRYTYKSGKAVLECIEKKVFNNNKNGGGMDPRATMVQAIAPALVQLKIYCFNSNQIENWEKIREEFVKDLTVSVEEMGVKV